MILQAFIRGAIIIVIATLLATLLRNRSAALRHHVWATAVVVQLALVAFIPVLPTIKLPVIPTITAKLDAPLTENPQTDPSIATPSVTPPARPDALTPRRSDAQAPPAAINWIFAIWAAGAALIFARYVIGTLIMWHIAYTGRRIEDSDWLVLVQRTARELGITRPITMIWGNQVSVPVTWGVLYPMVLLPQSAREWSEDRRRFVLVHELAHVKRFDALTQFLAQITTALFWFSPFVWLAEWRMRVERECACDDTVIEHGTEPTLYADELLQMVRSLMRRRTQQPAFAALAMARKSEFEGRMLAILDPDRPRRVTGITSGLLFALLSVLIAVPVAAIDPFALEVVTTPLATDLDPAPIAPVASTSDCDLSAKGMGITADVGGNPKNIDIKFRQEGRCVLADLTWPVQLSTDERRILAVEPGGFVRLREVTPQRDVELVIEHPTGANVKRAFSINARTTHDDGATEREWVARVLPEVLSEAAIDPAQRVTRMLKSNGFGATLRQIAALHSRSARLAHFKALIVVNEWTDAELTQIRTSAEQSLSSSATDLEAFKRVLSRRASPVKALKAAGNDVELMEQVLTGITSNYDLRVAMMSQLFGANRETLLMFMRAAQRMSSGYELGTFLIATTPYYLGKDAQLVKAWFSGVGKVSSSYERRLVLMATLDYAQGKDAITSRLLNALTDMSSSYEKTVVLTAVATRHLITTPELRTAFLAQVNTITSSTDRAAILVAL